MYPHTPIHTTTITYTHLPACDCTFSTQLHTLHIHSVPYYCLHARTTLTLTHHWVLYVDWHQKSCHEVKAVQGSCTLLSRRAFAWQKICLPHPLQKKVQETERRRKKEKQKKKRRTRSRKKEKKKKKEQERVIRVLFFVAAAPPPPPPPIQFNRFLPTNNFGYVTSLLLYCHG